MSADNTRYVLPATVHNTVEEQIIQYFVLTLANASFLNDTTGEPGTVQKLFECKGGNNTGRGSIADIPRSQTPGFAVEEGSQRKEADLYPYTDKILRVFVNFKVYKEEGVDHIAMCNYYVGRIIKLFVTDDDTLGGLAMDCSEAGNTPETNGWNDPEPGGTVFFDVHYRHQRGDMFRGYP